MNSIKNAIVTVTLLAVGYGSYVVLKDPMSGPFPDHAHKTLSSAGENLETPNILIGELLPDVEVTVGAKLPDTDSKEPESFSSEHQLAPRTDSAAQQYPPSDLPPLPQLIEQSTSRPSGLMAKLVEPPRPELNIEEPAAIEEPVVSVQSPPQVRPTVDSNPQFSNLVPVASKIEPPVAATSLTTEPMTIALDGSPTADDAVEPLVKVVVPKTNPFANPVVADNTTSTISEEVDLPMLETNLEEPLIDSLPPMNKAVGPIPPANENDGSLAFERVWSDVQEALRAKDLNKALQTLTPWSSDSGLSEEQTARCMRLLDELAGTVIYSRYSYLEPLYEVQAGETLDEIAAKYAVPQELLAKINGIAPPFALSTGEEIKVVRGPFRAIVDLPKNELTLYAGSRYAGRFPVKIGRDLPPEAAFYEVAEKSDGRSYFDRRAGREVLKGDADNRYGERWLGLRGEHITTGHSVGIHGQSLQSSDQDVGSIRLSTLDAEDVFSILSVGSRVEVRQ